MPRGSSAVRRLGAALALFIVSTAALAQGACKATLYLTIDTGSMRPAEEIAATLRKHSVKATFFVANEKTYRGDYTLDPSWAGYWRERVAEGHKFGNHTWHHWYFRGDLADGRTRYVQWGAKTGEVLDQAGVCAELKRTENRFRELTGRALDPLWRAPGGRTTKVSLSAAKTCGYDHVHWADAGFLGDELPSDTYPNAMLLKRALANLRDGDIVMMHLGIYARKDPFWPMLDPLLGGLKGRGFCFATLPRDAR